MNKKNYYTRKELYKLCGIPYQRIDELINLGYFLYQEDLSKDHDAKTFPISWNRTRIERVKKIYQAFRGEMQVTQIFKMLLGRGNG